MFPNDKNKVEKLRSILFLNNLMIKSEIYCIT